MVLFYQGSGDLEHYSFEPSELTISHAVVDLNLVNPRS
jgi:hypothetical protein